MKRGMIGLSLLFFLVMPCATTAGDWLEQTSREAQRNLETQRQHGGFYPNSPGPGPSGQGSGVQPSGQGSGEEQRCPPGWFFADSPFGQGKCMPKSK